MKISELNWSEVTPEGFDRRQNQALHILNHSMMTPESRQLSLIFLVGRVTWFHQHLPKKCSQRIRIDTSGQSVSLKTLKEWKELCLAQILEIAPDIQVNIEFLVD